MDDMGREMADGMAEACDALEAGGWPAGTRYAEEGPDGTWRQGTILYRTEAGPHEVAWDDGTVGPVDLPCPPREG